MKLRKRILISYLIILIFFIVKSIIQDIPSEQIIVPLLIFIIGTFPALRLFTQKKEVRLPILEFIGLFYAFTFALPVFFQNELLMYHISLDSLLIILFSLVLFYLFFFTGKKFFKGIKKFNLPEINRKDLLITGWLFFAFSLIRYPFPQLNDIVTVSSFFEPASFLGINIFLILTLKNLIPKAHKIFFWFLALPIDLFFRLATGNLARIMILGLISISIYFYIKKDVPVLAIFGVTLFFILLNPVKIEYRNYAKYMESVSNIDVIEKINLFYSHAINYYENLGLRSGMEFYYSGFQRINHFGTFDKVVQDTPIRVPYWDGETYTSIFTKFIPRVLLPDKPKEELGNEFGHRYGFLYPGDYDSSMNLPWLVELYANFGLLGSFLGMSLFGLIFSFVDRKFNSQKLNNLELLFSAAIIIPLTYQESNFSLVFGGLLLAGPIFYLILKLNPLAINKDIY